MTFINFSFKKIREISENLIKIRKKYEQYYILSYIIISSKK